ncbi:hypothetical protein Mapa_003537 [Marchantia paleacea]|nr:hypothetical protein Mapa_003537 [Marchantia paleacea]
MACFSFSGRRALSTFVSRIRSVSKCCQTSTVLGESAFARTSRSSIPCAQPNTATASADCSAKSFLGSRTFSAYLSRSPSELACVQSLLPLHSVTAAARLVSHLSSSAGEAPAILHDDLDGT